MDEDTPVQAPTDIAGVAIHLSYIRRDMKNMSIALSNITSNYVPITVYLEHKTDVDKRLADLETKAALRQQFEDKWSGRVWGINSTIGVVIGGAIFLIDHFLNK